MPPRIIRCHWIYSRQPKRIPRLALPLPPALSGMRPSQTAKKPLPLTPELGNPCNDMGVYLIEKNRLPEALTWLDRALRAPRYDSRHFSHYHRGRILERMARFGEARSAFGQAVKLAPDWPPAQQAYLRVLGGSTKQPLLPPCGLRAFCG